MDDIKQLLDQYTPLEKFVTLTGYSLKSAITRAKKGILPVPAFQFRKKGPFFIKTKDIEELIEQSSKAPYADRMKKQTPQEKPKRPPKATCLYRHFDSEGNLLYVGISASVMMRQASHSRESNWAKSIAKIEISWYDTYEEAYQAETDAIVAEKPKHNIAKVPKCLN